MSMVNKPENMALYHAVNKELDYTDVRSVYSKLISDQAEDKSFKLMSALKKFNIGKTCVLNRSSFTYEHQRRALGLSKYEFDSYKKVAKYYDLNEDKFAEAYAELGYPAWSVLLISLQMKSQRKTRNQNVREIITYIRSIKPGDDAWESHEANLKLIRECIERNYPQSIQPLDIDFVKYQDCGCCGKENMGDGHEVIFPENKPPYPICEACKKAKAKPDWERVANIYMNYSAHVERAYQSITNRLF